MINAKMSDSMIGQSAITPIDPERVGVHSIPGKVSPREQLLASAGCQVRADDDGVRAGEPFGEK